MVRMGEQGKMSKAFNRFADMFSEAAGSPYAFLAATIICITWAVLDRPFDWLDGISALTFWMLFSLQSSQNADTVALHAKLDEIIRAEPEADNALRGIEERT
jgi:low affinity Fe/Cu permease